MHRVVYFPVPPLVCPFGTGSDPIAPVTTGGVPSDGDLRLRLYVQQRRNEKGERMAVYAIRTGRPIVVAGASEGSSAEVEADLERLVALGLVREEPVRDGPVRYGLTARGREVGKVSAARDRRLAPGRAASARSSVRPPAVTTPGRDADGRPRAPKTPPPAA